MAAKPSAVELVAVRRFREEWERTASKRLRAHDPKVAAEYEQHGQTRRPEHAETPTDPLIY